MLRATIWRDLRWRALAGLMLVALPTAMVAASYAMRASADGLVAESSYLAYLDASWFRSPGPSAVFVIAAIIVSASRSLLGPRNDLAYILALPISRNRWLLSHMAASVAVLASLIVVAHCILVLGAVYGNIAVDIGSLALRMLAIFVAALAWIGVTSGILSIVRTPVIAVLLTLTLSVAVPGRRFQFQLPAQMSPVDLPYWDPWVFVDPRMWIEGVPVASISMSAVLIAAGTMIALIRINRMDV